MLIFPSMQPMRKKQAINPTKPLSESISTQQSKSKPFLSTGQNFLLDTTYNSLLVKQAPISFKANTEKEKEFTQLIKELEDNLKQVNVPQDVVNWALNRIEEVIINDEEFKTSVAPHINLDFSDEETFNNYKDRAYPGYDKFISFLEDDKDNPVHLSDDTKAELKKIYTAYAVRDVLNKQIYNNHDYYKFCEALEPHLDDDTHGIVYRTLDKFCRYSVEKWQNQIEEFNLSPETLEYKKKIKEEFGTTLVIPDVPELAKFMYELCQTYATVVNYPLPKQIDFLDFKTFSQEDQRNACACYAYDNNVRYSPRHLASNIVEYLQPDKPNIAEFTETIKDAIQHETVGHFLHRNNAGTDWFYDNDKRRFESFLTAPQKRALNDFKSAFFEPEPPDLKKNDKFKLTRLLENLDKAIKTYKENPSNTIVFSQEDFDTLIMPAYKRLQDINTIIDLEIIGSENKWSDTDRADYAKTNTLELVAVAAEVNNRKQFSPKLLSLLNDVKYRPYQDREQLPPEHPVSQRLKEKDDFTSHLISLRNKDGAALLSGNAISLFTKAFTPEKKPILDTLLEKINTEKNTQKASQHAASILKNITPENEKNFHYLSTLTYPNSQEPLLKLAAIEKMLPHYTPALQEGLDFLLKIKENNITEELKYISKEKLEKYDDLLDESLGGLFQVLTPENQPLLPVLFKDIFTTHEYPISTYDAKNYLKIATSETIETLKHLIPLKDKDGDRKFSAYNLEEMLPLINDDNREILDLMISAKLPEDNEFSFYSIFNTIENITPSNKQAIIEYIQAVQNEPEDMDPERKLYPSSTGTLTKRLNDQTMALYQDYKDIKDLQGKRRFGSYDLQTLLTLEDTPQARQTLDMFLAMKGVDHFEAETCKEEGRLLSEESNRLSAGDCAHLTKLYTTENKDFIDHLLSKKDIDGVYKLAGNEIINIVEDTPPEKYPVLERFLSLTDDQGFNRFRSGGIYNAVDQYEPEKEDLLQEILNLRIDGTLRAEGPIIGTFLKNINDTTRPLFEKLVTLRNTDGTFKYTSSDIGKIFFDVDEDCKVEGISYMLDQQDGDGNDRFSVDQLFHSSFRIDGENVKYISRFCEAKTPDGKLRFSGDEITDIIGRLSNYNIKMADEILSNPDMPNDEALKKIKDYY